MAQQQPENFYTDYGVKVTQRIEKGKTKFFESRLLAEAYAALRRSYKYEMFDSADPFKRNHVGYGVPA